MEYFKDLLVKIKADSLRAHKSLTIWFNSIAGALIICLPFAQDNLPQLQEYIPANWYHFGMCIVVVGNIILRFKTTTSLAAK